MALNIDPEIGVALGNPSPAGTAGPPVGDVEARRVGSAAAFAAMAARREHVSGVERTDYEATTADGATLTLGWYRSTSVPAPGSAVVYFHGGAFILPLLPVYDEVMRWYTAASGVPMLLVDYRVAPEHPHPTPAEDCYTALTWLAEHAEELGVNPDRIAVMGPALAQQILLYPMLDDRAARPDPQLPPGYLVFGYDDNSTGWGALLGSAASGDGVSPYAAPARATDLSGLPDAYVEVGDLDILRDEDIEYAGRLLSAVCRPNCTCGPVARMVSSSSRRRRRFRGGPLPIGSAGSGISRRAAGRATAPGSSARRNCRPRTAVRHRPPTHRPVPADWRCRRAQR